MIEIGGYPIQEIGQTARTLIHFKNTEIQSVVNNKIGSNNWSASIEMFIASAYETPVSHSIECFPVSMYWDGGIGKYGDDINTGSADQSGVSWQFTKTNAQTPWKTSPSFDAYTTGSHNTRYPGGGNWYTGSNGINLKSSQSYETNDDVDVFMDVSNAVHMHYSGTLANNGFILKFHDSIEFNLSSSVRHKFFSANTNTIYPPSLTFTWG